MLFAALPGGIRPPVPANLGGGAKPVRLNPMPLPGGGGPAELNPPPRPPMVVALPGGALLPKTPALPGVRMGGGVPVRKPFGGIPAPIGVPIPPRMKPPPGVIPPPFMFILLFMFALFNRLMLSGSPLSMIVPCGTFWFANSVATLCNSESFAYRNSPSKSKKLPRAVFVSRIAANVASLHTVNQFPKILKTFLNSGALCGEHNAPPNRLMHVCKAPVPPLSASTLCNCVLPVIDIASKSNPKSLSETCASPFSSTGYAKLNI